MKKFNRFRLGVITFILLVVSIKMVKTELSLFSLFLLMLSLGLLTLLIVGRLFRKGISKKYDRKPESPWGALNRGEDPTQ